MSKPTRMPQEMVREYLERGLWSPDTMVRALERHATGVPDGEAMSDRQSRLTWAQVKNQSDLLALGLLDLGLKRDDLVLIQLPNGVENLLVRIALKKAGLLAAFAPIMWRQSEMGPMFRYLDPKAVLLVDEFRGFDYLEMMASIRDEDRSQAQPHLLVSGDRVPAGAISLNDLMQRRADPQIRPDCLDQTRYGPDEVSLLSLSSGSTGEPKVCEWPEGAQVLIGSGIASRLKLTREDVVGIFAPVGGGAGAMAWLIAAQLGCRMVLSESMAAETILELIERERVSFMGTVPAILLRLLEHPDLSRYDLSSLRVIRTGTAALLPSVAQEAEAKLGCVMAPAYGSMETVSIAQAALDDPREIRLGGSVGRALPGIEVKLVDETNQEVPAGEVGELWVRGPGTSSGYFRDLEATRRAWGELGREGWFRTGDLAGIDAQGNLSLLGRKKQVIIRGGNKVHPAEIESILCRHPKVLEAAVVGVPHPVLGEVPCAFVIPRTGVDVVPEEFDAFLRSKNIASYKIPEEVLLMDEFPRLDSNKVNRLDLVQRFLSVRQAKE